MNQGSQRPCSLSMKKVPCLVHHQEEIKLLPLLRQLLLLAVNTTYVLVLSGRGRTRRMELRPREPASLFFHFLLCLRIPHSELGELERKDSL